MMKEWKRWAAVGVASVMSLSMLAACTGGANNAGGEKTSITIFNSKSEIQSQMEEMAQEYSESKGVKVEVYYSNDTVAAHMATRYASNNPYTISMVDAKDVYSLAKEHAVDLSDQDWVKNTTQAIAIDGKTYGFPVSVEARGVMYNADAIKKATGKEFKPEDYKTLDSFKQLLADIKAGGLEKPVGIMKEDWSLAAHYLAEAYEERDNTAEFLKSLHDGGMIANDARFNSLMNTFDVLKENNYAQGDAAIAAERETSEQKLATGEIAFMFGGNWDWALIEKFSPTMNMGMMPVPQNDAPEYTDKLVGGGSKFFFIDSSDKTSEAQRKAAKDFLNWLANEKEGQDFIVNKASLVSPFKNNTLEVKDPLGKSVKMYADKGALVPSYNYMPDDHYSVLGAEFQKYLAGQADRAAFGAAIDSYWKSAKMDSIQ